MESEEKVLNIRENYGEPHEKKFSNEAPGWMKSTLRVYGVLK